MLVAASVVVRRAGARGGRRHRAGLGGGRRPRRRPAGRGRRPGRAAGAVRGRRRARRLLHRRRRAPGRPRADPQRRRGRAAAAGGGRYAGRDRPGRGARSRSSPSWCRPASGRATWSTSTSSAPISADAEPASREPPPDGPALSGATVVDAPELASSFGTSGKRQLVLAVPEAGRAGVLRPPGPLRRPEPHRGPARMRVVLLLAAGAAWETRALGLLSGRRDLVVLKRCVDVDDLLATATSGQADAAVVALEAPGSRPGRGRPPACQHGVRAVAVGRRRRARHGAGRPDRRARRGADDDLEALPEAITADQRARHAEPPPSAGRAATREPGGGSLAVWGPAGAPGRTTVATALAAALGRAGRGRPWSTPTPTAAPSPSSSASSTRSPACWPRPGWPASGMLEERFG